MSGVITPAQTMGIDPITFQVLGVFGHPLFPILLSKSLARRAR